MMLKTVCRLYNYGLGLQSVNLSTGHNTPCMVQDWNVSLIIANVANRLCYYVMSLLPEIKNCSFLKNIRTIESWVTINKSLNNDIYCVGVHPFEVILFSCMLSWFYEV